VQAWHPGGGSAIHFVLGTDRTPVSVMSFDEDPPAGQCTDVGTIVVDEGYYVGSTGVTTDCASLPNPLEGTCGAGLFDVLDCFAPSGSCTPKSDGSITWASGSRIRVSPDRPDVSGIGFQLTYEGPGGKHCGDATWAVQGFELKVEEANGNSWTVNQRQGQVTCPSGEVLNLDLESIEVFKACNGTGGPKSCALEFELFNACSSTDACSSGSFCAAGICARFAESVGSGGGACPTN
jgi:hypothetical protein